MSEASSYKLWLNWEAFEVAAVCPLFTAEISLDKIKLFAQNFDDYRQAISLNRYMETMSPIFKLSQDSLKLIYAQLEAFLLHDVHTLFTRSQNSNPDEVQPILKVTDILCYLFLMYVKKKYRNLSEVSSILEAFPSKKDERLSPRSRIFSSSTPTVGARMQIQSNKNETSQFSLLSHFFNTKLPQFLQILAPKEITKVELQSLSFLVCGGSTYTSRASSLAKLIPLEGMTPTKLAHHITNLLNTKGEESHYQRIEVPPTSPATYRPALTQHPNSPRGTKGGIIDKPILLSDLSGVQKLETPTSCPAVHIHNCKHFRGYFCGVISSIFISHCKDSIIFVGAASECVHMEYCANVTVVSASRLLHIDACTRCQVYALCNSRPLITGNSTKILLAPYNALYVKLPADLLVAGINPTQNYWKDPLVIGSFGQVSSTLMPPSQFNLFPVPFVWDRQSIPFSPDVPIEYANALEEKKNNLTLLRNNLDRIRAVNPDLAAQLEDRIKSTASKWIQDEGHMQEITWMYTLDQQ